MSLPCRNYATSVSNKCSFISEPTIWGRKVSGLTYCICMQVALVIKDPPDDGFRLGEGHGNPLQFSYMENPTDRAAWWATVHTVMKSWTWLKQLSMHACTYCTLLFTFFFMFFCSAKFKENNHRGEKNQIQNPIANRYFKSPMQFRNQ